MGLGFLALCVCQANAGSLVVGSLTNAIGWVGGGAGYMGLGCLALCECQANVGSLVVGSLCRNGVKKPYKC